MCILSMLLSMPFHSCHNRRRATTVSATNSTNELQQGNKRTSESSQSDLASYSRERQLRRARNYMAFKNGTKRKLTNGISRICLKECFPWFCQKFVKSSWWPMISQRNKTLRNISLWFGFDINLSTVRFCAPFRLMQPG